MLIIIKILLLGIIIEWCIEIGFYKNQEYYKGL